MMAMMKQLQQLNDDLRNFMEGWDSYYQEAVYENPDQLTLDDYAIPDEESNPQPVSFVAIQKHLTSKAREGYSDQIRELIQSYGVDKLSAIRPEDYPKLWQEVDQLGR